MRPSQKQKPAELRKDPRPILLAAVLTALLGGRRRGSISRLAFLLNAIVFVLAGTIALGAFLFRRYDTRRLLPAAAPAPGITT